LVPFTHRLLAIPPRLLLLLIVWTLVWKGLALWRAARAGQAVWFVVLLIVNTGGLLEIVYLACFAPRRPPLAAARPGASAPPPGGS
jgi:methionyl-tRNA synthetase